MKKQIVTDVNTPSVTDTSYVEWYAKIPMMTTHIEDEDTNELLTAMLSMCEYIDDLKDEIGEVASNMLHTTSWTHP